MRRIALVLVGLASFAAPSVAQAASARPGKAVLAHGTSPMGERWSASAGVSVNRRRHLWRFNVDFKFSNGFGWGGGQEIPIGSHKQEKGQTGGDTGLLSGTAPEAPPSAMRDPK